MVVDAVVGVGLFWVLTWVSRLWGLNAGCRPGEGMGCGEPIFVMGGHGFERTLGSQIANFFFIEFNLICIYISMKHICNLMHMQNNISNACTYV